uniref:Aspartate dehydrogenase domain-containing protein n=1 Tax=Caligus rogercresseyi TaxID=217165 RepID=C1BNT3_CALRO|nr:L-aspartate dehydrogenase [Caligus rogercresseyi]
MEKKRVGIVGFGNIGKYLYNYIINESTELSVEFVWNRTASVLTEASVPKELIINSLDDFVHKQPDIIVEVAHPDITLKYGELFLSKADTLLGSPTALANPKLEAKLKACANEKHGLYVPSGAFWGGEDIRKMADLNSLTGLTVVMTKHPSCLKLKGYLDELNKKVLNEAVVLYDGPIRELCSLAPNNVNTMAAAAVAAHNLGFDQVRGRLISDPRSLDWHEIRVSVTGPSQKDGRTFTVETVRSNPANPGVVTGSATYSSFLSSLKKAGGQGPGFHLC